MGVGQRRQRQDSRPDAAGLAAPLDRTPPAQILCLAYTKAAAANMAERIFGQLAEWTSLDDDALAKAVVDCGAPAPGPQDLAFARQLFARTIETPGGLKIQTLHAFAERLLRLFPFEANVPAHFKVIDERESKLMLIEARDAALAALNAAPEERRALDLVAREAGAHAFDDLLKEALGRSEAFTRLRRPGGLCRRARPPARACARRDGHRRRNRDARRRSRAHATRCLGASARAPARAMTASSR